MGVRTRMAALAVFAGAVCCAGPAVAADPPPSAITLTVSSAPYVRVPGSIEFTYTVTNTGSPLVTGVSVTDLNCSDVQPDGGIGILAQGEHQDFHCTRELTSSDSGPLTEEATASASDGIDPQTANGSTVFTAIAPALSATADPSFARPGGPLVFGYTVTNTGDSDLHDVTVDDDACTAPTSVDPDPLAKNATRRFTCSTTAPIDGSTPTPSAITPSALAVDDGSVTGATTTHSTTIIHPGITLHRDAPASVERGSEAALTYTVENTSTDSTLTNVHVADDSCSPVSTAGDPAAPLAPRGQRGFVCAKTVAGDGPIVSTATASADAEDGLPVSASAQKTIAVTERPVETPTSQPVTPTQPATQPDVVNTDPVLRSGTCINLFNGSAKPDHMMGSKFGDVLLGGAGNDFVDALDGDDCVLGDAGNDKLYGGNGNDDVRGLAGKDFLSGGNDNDTVTGAAGNDTVYGGFGNDKLNGGTGKDRLAGNAGNDKITGGKGNDTFYAGAGRDTIDSRDRVAEKVNCGSGSDKVRADKRDRLIGCERVKRG